MILGGLFSIVFGIILITSHFMSVLAIIKLLNAGLPWYAFWLKREACT